jgi:hypothetical protein
MIGAVQSIAVTTCRILGTMIERGWVDRQQRRWLEVAEDIATLNRKRCFGRAINAIFGRTGARALLSRTVSGANVGSTDSLLKQGRSVIFSLESASRGQLSDKVTIRRSSLGAPNVERTPFMVCPAHAMAGIILGLATGWRSKEGSVPAVRRRRPAAPFPERQRARA